MQRRRITLSGLVQGIGFRPLVYRLAKAKNLAGSVWNDGGQLIYEIEGPLQAILSFKRELKANLPPGALLDREKEIALPVTGQSGFSIATGKSQASGIHRIMADRAPCSHCLQELFDAKNRRYGYPFISCTECGPRFSIIKRLPYCRENLTLAEFSLCADCLEEFQDPVNRRFHAETISCAKCGPELCFAASLSAPEIRSSGKEAIAKAAQALVDGKILALKGVGGYQLLVRADANKVAETAVNRLRQKKFRKRKPFAVMAAGIEQAHRLAWIAEPEAQELLNPARPIVLLLKKTGTLCASVGAFSAYAGIFLPTSPLHYLLLSRVEFPVVATSANRSEEPIALGEDEAWNNLKDIADFFLWHNYTIQRRLDDSVLQFHSGESMVLRAGRGIAPQIFQIPFHSPDCIVAAGAHMKVAPAIFCKGQILAGAHVGDLDTMEASQAYSKSLRDLQSLTNQNVDQLVQDMHPEYASTHEARRLFQGKPETKVPHHLAHALSIAVERDIESPYLAVIWDGTGLSEDGRICGSEFLEIQQERASCLRSMRPVFLPGGESAIREPWRIAVSLLVDTGFHFATIRNMFGREDLVSSGTIPEVQLQMAYEICAKKQHGILASGMGRLFDGIAALFSLVWRSDFDGEAAQQLEYCAMEGLPDCQARVQDSERLIKIAEKLPGFTFDSGMSFDWRELVRAFALLKLLDMPASLLSLAFHQKLSQLIFLTAEQTGLRRIAFGGGVFQNRILLGEVKKAFIGREHCLYFPGKLPPGDGGLAAGQILALLSKISSAPPAWTADAELELKKDGKLEYVPGNSW